VSEWQPISTAPKDGTVVLFAIRGERHPFMGRADDFWNNAWWLEQATHWMPIPPPPTSPAPGQ
jgi:hypothetical protein